MYTDLRTLVSTLGGDALLEDPTELDLNVHVDPAKYEQIRFEVDGCIVETDYVTSDDEAQV